MENKPPKKRKRTAVGEVGCYSSVCACTNLSAHHLSFDETNPLPMTQKRAAI